MTSVILCSHILIPVSLIVHWQAIHVKERLSDLDCYRISVKRLSLKVMLWMSGELSQLWKKNYTWCFSHLTSVSSSLIQRCDSWSFLLRRTLLVDTTPAYIRKLSRPIPLSSHLGGRSLRTTARGEKQVLRYHTSTRDVSSVGPQTLFICTNYFKSHLHKWVR